MFTQLRFQNFKSWQDTGDIRMAPLTGFFGPNSSGKTAILQFLLMLKQTVESSDRNRILHTGDAHTYVDLGTTYDLIHQHQLPNQISFNLRWQPTPTNAENLPLLPCRKQDTDEYSGVHLSQYRSALEFSCTIFLDLNNITVNNLSYIYTDQNQQQNAIEMTRQNSNFYNLTLAGETIASLKPSFIERLSAPFKFYSFPVNFFKFSVVSTDGTLRFIPDEKPRFIQNDFLDELVLSLENQLKDLYYLGPLREYPRRIYNWSGEQLKGVGQYGESTIQALLTSRKDNSVVQEKVAYWLKELGLIHDFQLQPIAANRQEYELLVRRTPGSSKVSLKDVGFGVSQVLPVLVLCYYAPQGATIIFEQPEIHLHPSVQAGLADIFIDVIKTRNVQIIIESHSEHLLRRLQRRIAEETQHFSNQDAALYFCHVDQEGKSVLDSLQLDPYGNISNWPNGFFGDEMGDLVAMTEAAMQRQLLEQRS
ncbi:MAG: DUF3696 domain-containing protein [Aphanocapsa sp. GSE-SYN-MK-11-07L]|jgi:predicted ATPase|nr:DUF3696 domain-containing protein [Aphanocapsa sp. GSE-SYN-MK-11-07L]